MKIRVLASSIVMLVIVMNVAPVVADGLIHNLPADGTWVRYDMTGEARNPDGELAVSVKGTLLLKSVGRESVDGTACRWIEIEGTTEFQRGDQKREQIEIYKILVPEKYLTSGQNPRAHVLKAWVKAPDGVVSELDMQGDGKKKVESQDEFFHATPSKIEKQEDAEIKTSAGMFRCTRVEGHERTGTADVTTLTWLTKDVPFGVAAYRHSKVRKRDGESLGERWMELKLAEVGKEATSALGK